MLDPVNPVLSPSHTTCGLSHRWVPVFGTRWSLLLGPVRRAKKRQSRILHRRKLGGETWTVRVYGVCSSFPTLHTV